MNSVSITSESPEAAPPPPLRSYAEIHRDVWRVVRSAPAVFVLVPAILWFPADAMLEMALRRLEGDWLSELRFVTRAGAILDAIIGTLVTAVYLAALRDLGAGRPIATVGAVKAGFALWGRILVVYVSAGIRVGLAMLLLIIPGLYLALRYALAAPAAAFEGKNGVAALDASAAYMKGRYWRVALGCSAAGLIYLPLGMFPAMVVPNGMNPWLIALSELPFDVLASFLIIGLTLLYADFRQEHSLLPPVARADPAEAQVLSPPPASGRRGVAIAVTGSLVALLTAFPLWTWLATRPIDAGDEAWEREAYEDALKHYRHAAYWDPEDAYVHYSIGWALYNLDRISEGAPHFEQAVKLEPDNAQYRFDHARILSELGQIQAARSELAAAREHGFSDMEALEAFEASLDARTGSDQRSEDEVPD